MKNSTPLKIVPFILLAFLVILTLMAFKRVGDSAEEAGHDAAQAVARLEQRVDREGYAVVAFVVLMGLLTFITWTALRADKGKDQAPPSTGDSNSHTHR